MRLTCDRRNNEILMRAISKDISPSESVNMKMLKPLLKQLMNNRLTPRERQVLDYRFGLTDGYSRTLKEVGKVFNVGVERTRQMEAKGFRKLRKPSKILFELFNSFKT